REPNVAHWVVSDEARAAALERLRVAVDTAGPLGLDQATLSDRDRDLLPQLDGTVVDAGRVRKVDAVDPFAAHPYVAARPADLFPPPAPPADVTRAELHEMVRRGLVVTQDGAYFAPEAMDEAARRIAGLLKANPEGVTVAQVREALGTTRKYALPLLA